MGERGELLSYSEFHNLHSHHARMPSRRPNDHDNKIVPFASGASSGSTLPPGDDPAEWVYPNDSGDEFALRLLAGEVLEHDTALASLLIESAKGDLATGELVRRLNAWQASMGGCHKRSPLAPSPKPWLT